MVETRYEARNEMVNRANEIYDYEKKYLQDEIIPHIQFRIDELKEKEEFIKGQLAALTDMLEVYSQKVNYYTVVEKK